MEEFCKTNGLERKNVRFMLKGREVFELDTPQLIGMKKGDNIVAYKRLPFYSLFKCINCHCKLYI